eukprot:TRINITY_DN2381_c1_g1_i6.p1 TRINITY_DN2381_c1_g1~~TRINITY_DN2381_c1_g1_i6.p1  ORF type:complete len:2414 (+),score=543.24 TRINITY_DN2381_c1_g1_i6:70-7311(+)
MAAAAAGPAAADSSAGSPDPLLRGAEGPGPLQGARQSASNEPFGQEDAPRRSSSENVHAGRRSSTGEGTADLSRSHSRRTSAARSSEAPAAKAVWGDSLGDLYDGMPDNHIGGRPRLMLEVRSSGPLRLKFSIVIVAIIVYLVLSLEGASLRWQCQTACGEACDPSTGLLLPAQSAAAGATPTATQVPGGEDSSEVYPPCGGVVSGDAVEWSFELKDVQASNFDVIIAVGISNYHASAVGAERHNQKLDNLTVKAVTEVERPGASLVRRRANVTVRCQLDDDTWCGWAPVLGVPVGNTGGDWEFKVRVAAPREHLDRLTITVLRQSTVYTSFEAVARLALTVWTIWILPQFTWKHFGRWSMFREWLPEQVWVALLLVLLAGYANPLYLPLLWARHVGLGAGISRAFEYVLPWIFRDTLTPFMLLFPAVCAGIDCRALWIDIPRCRGRGGGRMFAPVPIFVIWAAFYVGADITYYVYSANRYDCLGDYQCRLWRSGGASRMLRFSYGPSGGPRWLKTLEVGLLITWWVLFFGLITACYVLLGKLTFTLARMRILTFRAYMLSVAPCAVVHVAVELSRWWHPQPLTAATRDAPENIQNVIMFVCVMIIIAHVYFPVYSPREHSPMPPTTKAWLTWKWSDDWLWWREHYGRSLFFFMTEHEAAEYHAAQGEESTVGHAEVHMQAELRLEHLYNPAASSHGSDISGIPDRLLHTSMILVEELQHAQTRRVEPASPGRSFVQPPRRGAPTPRGEGVTGASFAGATAARSSPRQSGSPPRSHSPRSGSPSPLGATGARSFASAEPQSPQRPRPPPAPGKGPAAAPPAAAGPPTASVPPITSSLSGGTAGVEPSPSSDIYADLPTAQSVVFGATFGHGAGTCESPQVRSADTELLGGEMSRASAFSLSYEAGASGSGARVGTTPVRPHDIWGAAAEKRMQNSSNLSHQDSLRSASQAARKSGGDGPAHRRRPSALERPAGSPLDGTVDSVLQRRQGRAGSRAQPLAVFSRTFSSVSPLPSPAQRQPDDSPSFRRRRAPKPKEKLSLAATARVGGSETVAPELPPGMPRGRRASVLAAGMEFLHLEDVHGAGSPAVPLEHNVWDGPLRRIRGAFGGSMRRRSGAPPAGSERPSPMERPGQKTPPRAETEPEGAFDALSHDNNPTRPYRTPPAQPVTLDDYDMHGATVTSRDFSRRRNRRASVLLRQLGDTGRSPLMFAHTARTPATVQLSETSPAPFAQTERKTVSFNVPHTPLGADAEHEIRSPLSASTAPSRSAHKGGKTSLFCWQSAIECYNASWQSYLGFDLGCPFASEFQRECAQERPQVRYLRISGEAMRNAREEGEPSEFDGIAVFPMVPAGAPPSKQPLALSPVSTSGVARVYELSKMARLAAYKLCSPAGNPRRDPVHWVLEVAQESTEGPWLQIDERDDYSLVPMERKAWTERLEIAPLCAPVLTRYARHTTLPTDYRLAEGWAAGSGVDAAAAGRLALWRLSADFLQGAEHGRHELLPACFGGLEWCETWEGGVLAEYLVISRESSSGVSAAALRRVAPDSWAPVPGCPRLFELPASRGAAWRAAAALVDAAAAQQGGECMLLSPAELASLELEDDPPQVGAACRWGAVIAGAATSLRPRITSGAILLEVAKATVTSTEAARAQLAAAVARGQATEVCVTSPPDERLCMLLAELRRALSAEPGLAAQCDDGQEREPFGSLEEQRRLMRGCQSTQGLNCVPEIVCTEGEYRRALAQLRGMLSVMAALPYADTAPSAQSPSREQQQSAWAPEIPPPCRHGDRAAAAAAGAALVAVLAADALGWALWRRFVLRAERIARRLRRDWTFHYPPPGRTVPNCFSGTEFVNALQQHFRCGPVTALRAFEALRVRGVVYRVERHARSNVAAADSSLWESRTLVLPFFDGSSAEGAAGDWPEGALAAALDVRPAPGAPDGLSCTPLRDPPPPDLRGTEYVHAEAYGYALVSTVVVPMLELQAMLFSSPERVILAFRGTANVANMKLDMRCCSDTGRRIDGHGWTGFGSVRERLREWSTSRSRTLRTTARRCCYCRGKRTKLARPLCGKQGRLTWLCRRVRSLGSTRPRVHAGFMHAWKLLEPAVLHEVRRECPADDPRPLYVTGHSLGGALATLAAFSISWKMYGWAPGNEPLKEVRCYTFGCPMAGNLAFTAIYEQAVPESFMVAVDGDPVPQIPCCLCTCTSYRHAGTYVHLNNIGSGSWAVDPTWLDQGIIPTLMCPKLNSHRMAVIADCLNRCLEHLRPGNWPLNWALGTQHLLPGSEDQSEDPLPDRPQPGCSEYEWPWMPLPMAPFAESYDEQALSSGLADQSPEFAADEDGMQAVPIPVPGGEYSAAETTTVHVQTGSAGLMRSEADTGRVGRAEGSGGLPAPCPPLPPPATDGGPCGASDAAAHCPPPSPA